MRKSNLLESVYAELMKIMDHYLFTRRQAGEFSSLQ